MGIISHCIPSGHMTQFNIPEQASQLWQWMKGWSAWSAEDRRHRHEWRWTDSKAEANLMPVIQRHPSLPPRPSPSTMHQCLLSRYAAATPSAPRTVEAPPACHAPLVIIWPLDYNSREQRNTARIYMVGPEEFLHTINIPGNLVLFSFFPLSKILSLIFTYKFLLYLYVLTNYNITIRLASISGIVLHLLCLLVVFLPKVDTHSFQCKALGSEWSGHL